MKQTTRPQVSVAAVIEELGAVATSLGPEMQTYFAYNRGRYVALAGIVSALVYRLRDRGPVRLLDVGPGYQTLMFNRLWPEIHIDTIGFPDDKFPPLPGEQRIHFDLNSASDTALLPALPAKYDLVTYCEVVEHLYTSPVHSLRFLGSALTPNGYMLVTTPNGVALHRRVRLLFGRNPQELIREDLSNPGHYREYARRELIEIAHRAGLSEVSTRMGHYTSTGSLSSRIFGAVTPSLPGDLRKDMAIVFQRTETKS